MNLSCIKLKYFFVHMYIYTYIHTYININTYIYTYIQQVNRMEKELFDSKMEIYTTVLSLTTRLLVMELTPLQGVINILGSSPQINFTESAFIHLRQKTSTKVCTVDIIKDTHIYFTNFSLILDMYVSIHVYMYMKP